jgi:exopolysaccharide biosynthesis polyprenyl glycosylphosphotransferase
MGCCFRHDISRRLRDAESAMTTLLTRGSEVSAEEWATIEAPTSPGYEISKRAIDIAGALVGLIMFAPLLVYLAVMVKLESEGPVFFRQRRVGLRGREFTCYKIRSMVADAEALKDDYEYLNEADGAAFKIRQDPRVTRVGKFVRRSSLDEFPQLWNVLRGDMSIVGPRPQILEEVEQYTPEHRQRLLVKPGITCLWQVSGRNDVDFEEWMRLDREYIRRRGFKTDLWILCQTLPAVIARKGAY